MADLPHLRSCPSRAPYSTPECCNRTPDIDITSLPDFRSREYYQDRRPVAPSWPEDDPVPEVLDTDPRPDGAPGEPRSVLDIVKRATAAGWLVRVGYSRGPVRAVKVGTYKMVETFGLWSSEHPDTHWRFYAMHARTIGAATGWKWERIGIWRPGQGVRFVEASVTDLKEFILVRGSVLPSWFKAIHTREASKKSRARVEALGRRNTTKPREGLA